MIEYFNPWDQAYPSVGMNPGAATKDWIFAGGMAFDFVTMKRSAKAVTVAEETSLCLEEIQAILEAAGASLQDLLQIRCYVSDDSYRDEMRNAYVNFFGDEPHPVQVILTAGIAGGCRVELDAIATRPNKD